MRKIMMFLIVLILIGITGCVQKGVEEKGAGVTPAVTSPTPTPTQTPTPAVNVTPEVSPTVPIEDLNSTIQEIETLMNELKEIENISFNI